MTGFAGRLAAAAAVLMVTTGCVQNQVTLTPRPIEPLVAPSVPKKLLDLSVGQEDVTAALERYRNSYVTNTALYSLRQGKLLQATLQISLLNELSERSPDFERSVVGQIGGSVPRVQRIGTDTVYLTRGTKQNVSIWFHDRYMFVLATRDEYPRPRTLLRAALAIDPGGSS